MNVLGPCYASCRLNCGNVIAVHISLFCSLCMGGMRMWSVEFGRHHFYYVCQNCFYRNGRCFLPSHFWICRLHNAPLYQTTYVHSHRKCGEFSEKQFQTNTIIKMVAWIAVHSVCPLGNEFENTQYYFTIGIFALSFFFFVFDWPTKQVTIKPNSQT